MNEGGKDSQIQVIDRATALLDAIARYPEPVRLKVLSAETGLHTSTAHRILNSLIDNGFVEREPSGHYRLGLRLLQLSVRLHSSLDLRSIALPFMEKLRDKLNETVHLTIREGDVLIYIDKATPTRMMHVQLVVGSRAPLHVTAVGKLMLGAGSEEEILNYSHRTNLPAYTRNTITDPQQMINECSKSIKRGYGLDNEEAEIDVGCIGALITDSRGSIAGGISVSMPIERRRMSWIEDLIKTRDEISAQLG